LGWIFGLLIGAESPIIAAFFDDYYFSVWSEAKQRLTAGVMLYHDRQNLPLEVSP
jgi:hypothetical protein